MTESERKAQLQIRCTTSTYYSLQKTRIEVGNRLVQSMYQQMGVKPSKKLDDADKESMKMLKSLEAEYKLISDRVAEKGYSIKKAIKDFGNDELQVIKNELDFKLADVYETCKRNENETLKVLSKYVHEHPMWDLFFKDVIGCGELMAAVCISYLDVEKARHCSSFFKYCGLDAVQDVDKNGNPIYLTKDGTYRKCIQKFVYFDALTGEAYFGDVLEKDGNHYTEDDIMLTRSPEVRKSADGEDLFVYEIIETCEEYVGDVMESKHGRRMGDTEWYDYTDKDGVVRQKRGITYNPVLRTRLLGVLASCIIKAGQRFGYNKYEEVYRDSRTRQDNSRKNGSKSDAQKHKMAVRYMIREFLRDMWVVWRDYEGYEVTLPYEVEYLGNKPHKYNQAQVDKVNTQNYAKYHKENVM